MPRVDLVVSTPLEQTPRVKQLCGMFDVPPREVIEHAWSGDLPIDDDDWNVGLIVGPSGSGKSSILGQVFGKMSTLKWRAASVVDDFDKSRSIQDVAEICGAVGFNTIPSWMKPYKVLSNGERFRVDLARRLLELPDPIVVDEFTSVVDRQVAQIGAHAVQKHVRAHKRRFVAATCHYDVVDWLQPDWVLEPATMSFQRRSVQRRPALDVEIARVDHEAWELFAPFHYLTADLHRGARCYVLFVGGQPAAFAGMLHRPHARVDDIQGCSRLVTLPDYQGLGLAFALIDRIGAAYRAIGKRVHTYPAHPSLIRSFDRSNVWALNKRPGAFSPTLGDTSGLRSADRSKKWHMGARPCAVFEYAGPAMDRDEAKALLAA